jgi:hypothetical protein
MKRNTEKHSGAMIMANSLVGRGIGRREAMRLAWALIKLAAIDTKTAGVTHGRRQEALERLARYPSERVSVAPRRGRETGSRHGGGDVDRPPHSVAAIRRINDLMGDI